MTAGYDMGLLEFCKVFPTMSHADALWEAIESVQHAERLGYSRFWLTEHHTSRVGHSSPEILAGILAGATERIRIGAGGLLLRYYSPLKVACDFRLLNALYPERIDLGIARGLVNEAYGVALHDGAPPARDFGEKVEELMSYLRGRGVHKPSPRRVPAPATWMLGSRGAARRAARLGTALCIDVFLDPVSYEPELVDEYRRTFVASEELQEPAWSVCVAGICAESDGEARVLVERHLEPGTVATIVGSPDRCRERFEELAELYHTQSFVFCDMSPDLESRMRSQALLAEALAIRPAGGDP